MKAELINLDDFIRSGEGANGASYNHKTDSDVMVKLYFDTMEYKFIETEVQVAHNVFNAGIPSPEPGDLVTDGKGRYGIRFRRIVDKESFARAVSNHPEKTEEYATEFAKLCKQLHSTHVDTGIFQSVKEQYLNMLKDNEFFDAEEKAILEKIIVETPDTDTAIHGDLQFGNALIAGGKKYFIDLGEFAYGNPLFDLGMTVFCSSFNDEAFTQEAFHMSNARAYEFWEYFVKEYWDGRLTTREAEEMLIPYALVKSLLIERNAKMRIESCHKLMDRYKASLK